MLIYRIGKRPARPPPPQKNLKENEQKIGGQNFANKNGL
jgi:hypothetical protein